jgi:tetratricopeptide (TPR) repeat protein
VFVALALTLGALLACKKKGPPPPAPSPASSAPVARCASGRSVDPPHAELNEAVAVMKAKEYAKAQELLDGLIKKYPDSATVRVWRGDAALFDEKKTELAGADEALPFYTEAEKLHDLGCRLAEMDHYYLGFDSALAHLRKDEARPALRNLEPMKQQWPDSADVFYNSARAYCLDGNVDKCAADFEQALTIAKTLRRPKFLRSHHSVDDWIRRSRKQSEFPLLRKDPRYAKIITRASG